MTTFATGTNLVDKVSLQNRLFAALSANGCAVDDRIEETEQGVFGWVMDPEGNRVELWQAPKGQ